MLWYLNEIWLFIFAFAAFLLVAELGFRLGRRQLDRSDDPERSHVSALQAALLGLLALLLGFNFAMASSRFDARKALIEDEASSIRTAWLRSQLLTPPNAEKTSALLRDYAAARIDFLRAGTDGVLLERASNEATKIQTELWSSTESMMSQEPSSVMAQFIQSLNDLINLSEKRRVALDNHVPDVVLHLLFTVALGAFGFIAYGYGLTGLRRHYSTGVFAILIALVLTTIVDLDQPRSGFIQVDEGTMIRLKTMLDQNAKQN